MYTIKKTCILTLIIVLIMVSHLLGVTNVTGKLLIPTAEGIEPYKCVIVVTPSAIVLECEKKIFQPLNQFDSPKERKIKLNITEIKKVEIQSPENMIYIITGDSFTMCYRNYYHRASIFRNIFDYEEFWVLAFVIDNPADTAVVGEELKKILGERSRILDKN